MKRFLLSLPLLALGCSSTDRIDHDPGGDAGVGSDASNLPGSFTREDAVRSTALLLGCLEDGKYGTFVDAFLGADNDSSLVARWGNCLSAKTNACTGMTECTGVSVVARDSCETTCDGDVNTFCEDGLQISFDCSTLDPDGPPLICVAGEGCEFFGTTACNADTFEDRCEANSLVQCRDNVELKTACPVGLVCSETLEHGGLCVGSEGSCEATTFSSVDPLDMDFAVKCNSDDELEFCANGGTHVIKCSEYLPGYSCQTVGGSSFCGLGRECIPHGPARTDAVCNQDSVEFCAAGLWASVDCTELGFAGCMTRGPSVACGPV